MAQFFERAGGGKGCCMEHFTFLDNLGYLYLCWSKCWGVGVGKCWWAKVAGERVFTDHLECVGDVWIGC